MPNPFTTQQIADFLAFVKVRDSGRYNMLDRRAQAATGLTREEYMFVMKNFEALAAQVGEE